MTKTGRILIVVEELLFGYAIYVVLFDVYYGWWNFLTLEQYKDHLPKLILVGVSLLNILSEKSLLSEIFKVFIIVLIMCEVWFIRTAATNPGYLTVCTLLLFNY